MTITDAELISNGLAIIRSAWPQLEQFIPANAIPRVGRTALHFRTHSKDVLKWWLRTRGGKHFIMTASPPAEFFWLALQRWCNSDHIYVMWHRDGRKFWFHSVYWRLYGTSQSHETTAQQLDTALQRWATTSGDIAFSGDWGWCDPTTGRFDHDLMTPRKEQWEY